MNFNYSGFRRFKTFKLDMDYIFLSSYSSVIESELLGLDLTTNLSNANYIVNDINLVTTDKTLIIDLPIDEDISCNSIISRLPIGVENYKLEPIKLNYVEKYPTTTIILNKYLLNNLTKLNFIKNNNFLLGTDTEINGYLTAVGYKILN